MPATLRRTTVNLPVAPVGPENPLPPLAPLDEMHTVDERQRAELPPDMARQVGYAPLRSVLPVRLLDGYTRERTPAALDALVLENDRLRATVLPGLGGRVHSLHHKPTGRELLYTNPVFQPADFALNGAWFSGGIEWNIGATGHTTLSVAPVHAARVPAPDGGDMLRLWEWERLRDTPFQVDLWLPDGSDFLYVGVRIRNPHDRTVPVYWWSNIAVPEQEGTRVLVPAEETWYFAYERRLRRIPVPEWDGADRTYALRSEFPADYFYEIPRAERKWIASLDERGTGLVQTSTDLLSGRKLFVWGHGPGGRRWQQWLTEPGTGGYAEIQAGLARTQLEHVRLEAGREFAWLEAYGPLTADPDAVHGEDWAAARRQVDARLEEALPRADVDAAFAAWRPFADADPVRDASDASTDTGLLAAGSGWGALEVACGGYELPGTPFPAETMGAEQRPWATLLAEGRFPDDVPGPGPVRAAGPSLVSGAWRERLECASAGPLTDYHLGVAQWHAGDHAQAVRSWERSVAAAPAPWSLRALAFADACDDPAGRHPQRAADRYLAAVDLAVDLAVGLPLDLAAARDEDDGTDADGSRDADGAAAGNGAVAAPPAEPPAGPVTLAALVREAVPVLLAAGRAAAAAAVLDRLPSAYRRRGRFRLLRAQVLLAQGDKAAARAVFDEGFEVDDLREGDEVLGETWAQVSDEPLPARYDFRMRPA
ncbi:DUF5107 domain-containing protein [Streptomyces sp. Amel2xB2]|uniref:DUF5107 domain-containing protein n=1 Tax=Streptomyces sp. Amel2xB2 TaxID=1305829 RepID=UPI000DBA18A2|nr:DUF5107 domain-containing protein [Streptomyces sp. Amel2xB2]